MRPAEDEREARVTDRGAQAERLWYLAGILIAAAVAFTGFVSAFSASPRFCANCHASQAEALAAGEHAGTHCDTCHVSSGPLGLVENRLGVVSMVAAAPLRPFGVSSATSGVVDRRNCLRCHEAMLATTVSVNGIRMNHAAPQKAGWTCDRCHGAIGHAVARADARDTSLTASLSTARYTMDGCLECHSANEENIATCDVCHASESGQARRRFAQATPWRVIHGGNWRRTHGMGNLATCRACHSDDYCVTCHGIRLPHPDDFLASHGPAVVADGPENCVRCHASSSCDSCHGIEMPHPATFLKSHSTTVKASGDQVCERCHGESVCKQCHQRHTHPGIPAAKLKRLRANPVSR